MRLLTTILISLSTLICHGQLVIGKYANYFGGSFNFETDSTFKFTWHFDLASSWTNGNWKILNDTIYIEPKLVFDTLIFVNNIGFKTDTLVMSIDEDQNRIDSIEYIGGLLQGGGQNRVVPPTKLYIKNSRLYFLQANGKIDKSKLQSLTTGRYRKTYYIRVE